MKTEDILLNSEQKEAVEYEKGPLLIIAGAGTGKTTVITQRIKYLIVQGLAKPEEILALTFTEKAAKEMEERVDVALPYGTFGLWISTFHSFCDRILREEALNIGLPSDFKLMTEAETYLFVKKNFWKFDLAYFRPSGNPYKFIEGLIQHFNRLKDEDINTKDYITFIHKQKMKNASKAQEEETNRLSELVHAYEVYEDLKIKEGVMDFADLIGNVIKLYRKRASLLGKYKKQFRYVLVDEFQDTNFSQYQLVKLLSPAKINPNLTVVGDDSQSIYKFRGAAISNILSFMNDYTKAKQIILNTSYRCPQTILNASHKLIKYNDPNTLEAKLGISKNLIAHKNYGGEKIELIQADRVEAEAEKVVNFIRDYKTVNKKDYKDFAILVRANNHGEPFIRSLERARIPYQFLGPGMLFHRPEVKDLIAYLKVLYDFTDSVSLYRVLSHDLWQISPRDLIALLNLAKKANISLFEQLEQPLDKFNISDDSKIKLKKIVDMIHRHQKLIHKETAGQILYFYLIDSGLMKQIINYKTQAEERKALNITKFFGKLKSFEATHEDAGVFAVVDYLDLAMTVGESPLAAEIDWTENNAVNILTVHSAKGLEFPIVFLVNLVEGRFPSRDRRDQIPIPDKLIREVLPEGDYHLQEERRLFYVGMTRAEQKLVFSAANFYGEGKREKKLSPFVTESLGIDSKAKTLLSSQISQIPLFEWKKTLEEIDESERRTVREKTIVDYLSYSAIEAFRICPLHYKLKHILRIPSAPTAAQALGNSIHYALRDFYLLNQKQPLLQLLENNWVQIGYTSKKHEEQSLQKAKKFLVEYLKSELHKNSKPLFLERSFNFRIDPGLTLNQNKYGSGLPRTDLRSGTGVKILGKIDRADDIGGGNIEIIDYKTGANIPTQRQLDTNLQMTIYALAATNPGIFGKNIDQVTMSFYFFENATKVSTTRTKEQLSQAIDELLEIRSQIEKSDFRCSRGTICQNCEYKILCNE
ncbi:ATP-dependent helicase [Candidatus Roizmanbacteria bacterium]|nr:ATP-dependent helicase [Candidatus Roizmanbacteria bacterium]